MLKRLRSLKVSERQAVALAVCSGVVLLALIVAWLGISTRTAIVNQELASLTEQDVALTDKINDMWTEIGQLTSQEQMEQRARQAGFRPPDKIEYYDVMTSSLRATQVAAISATLALTQPVVITETNGETVTILPIMPITNTSTVTTDVEP